MTDLDRKVMAIVAPVGVRRRTTYQAPIGRPQPVPIFAETELGRAWLASGTAVPELEALARKSPAETTQDEATRLLDALRAWLASRSRSA